MIPRAVAILEALAGGAVDPAIMQRIANSFLPAGTDPQVATNQEKAEYFVRGLRQYLARRARNYEGALAGDIAAENARVAFDSDVNLGDD